jgi:toxin ParE1/3/4
MSNIHKRVQAERDLEECFVFLGERDLDTGLDFLFAAEQTFEQLAQMPFLGSPREFRSTRLRGLRQWHIKGYEQYLIFYRPTEVGIEVLRVLHSRRDIETVLEELN